MNRMIPVLAILASAGVLMGAKATQPEPKITFSVPAPCADVYGKVYTELDASWTVTVLDATKADEALPSPEELSALVSSVSGLEKALETMDAVDRDAFYVRVKTRSLSDLKKKYPAVDAKLLEAAKTQLCREAAAR